MIHHKSRTITKGNNLLPVAGWNDLCCQQFFLMASLECPLVGGTGYEGTETKLNNLAAVQERFVGKSRKLH